MKTLREPMITETSSIVPAVRFHGPMERFTMMTCNAKQRVERTGVSHDGVGQVELRYLYRDKDGKEIATIIVSPEDL